MKRLSQKLIFIYNADASTFGRMTDFLHKLLSPESYQCNLCRLTYTTFKTKKEWRKFKDALPERTVFLHRDEFLQRYPALSSTPLPAVFAKGEDGSALLLVEASEINQQRTISELQNLILTKLNLRDRDQPNRETRESVE